MPNRLARLTRHLAVLLLYGVLTCLALWPLPLFFTSKVLALNLPNDPNVAVDVYQHLWHQWWVAFALSHGQNPFFTRLLYYPEGIDLFWQTLGFLPADRDELAALFADAHQVRLFQETGRMSIEVAWSMPLVLPVRSGTPAAGSRPG